MNSSSPSILIAILAAKFARSGSDMPFDAGAATTMAPPSPEPQSFNPLNVLLAALVLVVVVTAVNPGAQWADSGHFIGRAAEGQWFSPYFYATSHPLFHTLSTVVFVGLGPLALNYLNAALLLPMMWLVFRLARVTNARPTAALVAAAAAPAIHCVAWITTKVEVYSLNAVLTLAVYWLVLDRPRDRASAGHLLLVGVLTGLSVAVHQLGLIVLFPLYLVLLVQNRWRMAWTAFGGVIGMLVCLPGLLDELASGSSLFDLISGYLSGRTEREAGWEYAMFRFDRVLADKNAILVLLLSLFGPGAIGLLSRPKGFATRLIWLGAVSNLLFAISYGVTDRFTFFLPGAILFATLGVVAVDRHMARSRFRDPFLAVITVIPMITLSAAGFASVLGLYRLPATSSSISQRNDALYFLAPWIRDSSPTVFLKDFYREDHHNPVLIADFVIASVLRSAQVQGSTILEKRTIIDCDSAARVYARQQFDSAILLRHHVNCTQIESAGIDILWR